MAVVLTIDGTTRQYKDGTLNISATANGRATASFEIVSTDGSVRPLPDDEVIITEDGTRIFGGLVDTPREFGSAEGKSAAIVTDVSAVDFHAYIERRIVSVAIPAGSLHAALTQLVETYLDDYGVTLDSGQVTGPTLPLLGYTVRPLREVLDDIAKITSASGETFVWRVDNFKALSMFQPSTEAAPFDLSGLPIPEVIGDVVVETRRGLNYANNVTVYVPGATVIVVNSFDAGEIASIGIWDKVLTLPDVPDETTAQEIADAELARSITGTKTVKYRTLETGLEPGQSQSITVARRNLSTSGVISDVVTRDFGKDRLVRDVTVVIDGSDTNLGKGWRDTYRTWAGDKTGGPTELVPVSGSLAPGSPDTAVQFNRAGSFGGDASFTYDETTNCLVVGADSDITAADPESCFVFGSDCHITD